MFKPNYFSRVLTCLAVLPLAFATPPPAQAEECVRGDGYTICFNMVSRNGQYNAWKVQLTNAYTTENMDVTCYGKDVDTWSSNGGLNQAEAQYLAEKFCSI